jgi:predicted nucleic acid-binding protein
MRILLDTNILVRAARGGTGPAAEALRQAVAQPHVLIVSPFLISEPSRTLRYPRLRVIYGLDEAGIDAYVQ